MRRLRALAATALLAATASAPPAGAANADLVVLQARGTVFPAWDLNLLWRALDFQGTATVVGTDGIGASYGCAFSGSELGTIAGGVGSVGGACGPLYCYPFLWARAGAPADITCTAATGVMKLSCVVRVHQALPAESYDITCNGTYTRVP